jgi:hypothetical protein
MIEITYRHHGQRPSQTDLIREDANAASTLPPSFAIDSVVYDDPMLTLCVDPPSDNISTNAVDAIASAWADRWGGQIDHVSTEVVDG